MKRIQQACAKSPLILGTAGFGTNISEKESYALMDTFAHAGGIALDTAEVYGKWGAQGQSVSENIVGAWLKNSGADMLLITKGAHYAVGKNDQPRVTPKDIDVDIAGSLDRLGRRIDLYFLHRDNPLLPVGPIMDCLHAHVKSGSCVAIGGSNWSTARLASANEYAKEKGITPFTASEVFLSYATSVEGVGDPTLVPFAKGDDAFYLKTDMPVLAFTPQAAGYFDKLDRGLPLGGAAKYDCKENRARFERIAKVAHARSASCGQIALAYLLHLDITVFPIVGCRTVDQLNETLGARKIALTQEEMTILCI